MRGVLHAGGERAHLSEDGQRLPWPDDHFAAFVSAGVFTQGHAPASSLDELVRVTRPGGYAIFNIRQSVFEDYGFAAKLAEQEKAGLVKPVETSPPFAGFAFGKDDVLGFVKISHRCGFIKQAATEGRCGETDTRDL